MIGRGAGRKHQSETELEQEIFESLKVTTGLALAYFSAQNIDRFVTSSVRASVPAGPLLLTCIWRTFLMLWAKEFAQSSRERFAGLFRPQQ